MRQFLGAIVLASMIAVPGEAGNPKPAASLKVGDPAPPLKVSRWFQGEAVRQFQPGKVYVIEFWATWCGPCILIMPHTAELQAQYRDQGVTVVAFTARDLLGAANNTEDQVAAFVKKRGPKLHYAFAYAADATTSDAWLKAAGKSAIPCAFVVDKAGRIAFIGNPMYLGVVLPRVLAGDTPQAVTTEVSKLEQTWQRAGLVQTMGDDKISLQALLDLEAAYPTVATHPFFLRGKLAYLVRVGEVDEARKLGEIMIAKAIEQDNPNVLTLVSIFMRQGQEKKRKELLAVAVKAAEARAKIVGDQDVRAMIDLANAYSAFGDEARARACAGKAGQAAGDKDTGTLINLADIYCAIGDKVEARAYAHKAGMLVGDRPAWLLINLANTYSALGDKAEARAYARKAGLAADARDVRELMELAKTCCAIGDVDNARAYIRKAGLAIDETSADYLLYLGDTCHAIGDQAGAREYARKAGLLAGAKDARVLLRLANSYFDMGDKNEARACARKAVAAAVGEYAALRPYIELAARKFDAERPAEKK
jgi:thiol-disulfide isomerase/thioredoxin